MEKLVLIAETQAEYELIDSGEEEKLERFGSIVLSRPDPQALWKKHLGDAEWQRADGRYIRKGREGEWKVTSTFPKKWLVTYGGYTFILKATSFKHTGLFPEQLSHWKWIKDILKSKQEKNVLNLFGYTGGATLAALDAGASVTHVDASKVAVSWAKENAELSHLNQKPVRWIVEDALTFVRREIKRGVKYDAIIMDPPAFGHGPDGELWKIEENFIELLDLCVNLLTEKPLFVLLSGYAAGYSPLMFAHNLALFKEKFGGTIEFGDLAIKEKNSNSEFEPRLLPCGIFGRWKTD